MYAFIFLQGLKNGPFKEKMFLAFDEQLYKFALYSYCKYSCNFVIKLQIKVIYSASRIVLCVV